MEALEGLRFYKTRNHFFMYFVLLSTFLCAPVFTVLDFGYEHLTEVEGKFNFSSPSLIGTYVWNISVANGYSVQTGFERIDLHCHSYFFDECSCFLFQIYDGVEYNSDNLLFSSICNNNWYYSYLHPWPGLTTSFSNNMLIILTGYSSDLHIQYFSGFYASVPAGGVTRNCENHITGINGVITSPSFPNNYTDLLVCNWYIHVDPAYRIRVVIQEMDIEYSNNCKYDSLQFRDGNNVSSLISDVRCGSYKGSPYTMYSLSSDYFLRFVSNWNVTGRGFIANWSIECGGYLYYENGTLQSPNYPANYFDNLECYYNFYSGRPGQQLVLEFLAFDLQEPHANDSCIFDYVEITDYNYWDSIVPAVVRRFCGRTLPSKVTTYFHTTVRFVSDAFIIRSGYQLKYHYVMSVDCGSKIITEKEGTVSSPGFPGTFPEICNCTWTIQVDTNQVIHLAFNFIDMYPFGSVQGERCLMYSKAHLQVFDGISTGNASSIGIYCGTEVSVPVISSGNAITLIFTSRRNYEMYTGFSTTFTAVEKSAVFDACGGNITGGFGEFATPYFPSTYPNVSVCVWVITGVPGLQIRLFFLDFSLENSTSCHKDSLEIREGSHELAPRLGRFCGDHIPLDLTTQNNTIHAKFVSDTKMSQRGFKARWISVCEQNHTQSSGTIQSPVYRPNYNGSLQCMYLIETYYPYAVQLNFSYLRLGDDCENNYIEVRDGGVEEAPLLGSRYCGTTNLPVLASTQSRMLVKFVTNGSFPNTTFSAYYSTFVPRDTYVHLTEPEGTFSFNRFNSTGRHVWNISVETGDVVMLWFVDIHFECYYVDLCYCGTFEIYDGLEANSANQLYRSCTENFHFKPNLLTSQGNNILIIFNGSNGTYHALFTAFYKSFHASEVKRDCGKHVTGMHGIITSPQFPNNYSNLMECEWVISVRPFQNIRLDMHQYDIGWSEWCRYDILQIRDGNNASSPLNRTYCGTSSSPENVLTSSGSNLFIRFVSNWDVTGRGFMLVWSVEPCDETNYTCEQ